MSKVVVFGYSGYAGAHITEELLSRGYNVVGVARNATADAQGRKNLRVQAGSAYDAGFVAEVAKDADAIVVAIPAAPEGQPELEHALPTLLDCAARSNARLGVVGASGSLMMVEGGPLASDSPKFPPTFKDEAAAHVRALDFLRAYDGPADWFCLTPSATFGPWNPGTRTGHYRLGGDVLIKGADNVSTISGPDFAIAFVNEVGYPKHHRTRFTVGYGA